MIQRCTKSMTILFFLFSCIIPLIPVTATKSALLHGFVNEISFSNFIPYEGYQLSGTPLDKIDIGSFFDCLIECTANIKCLSANVNTTSNAHGLLGCELLENEKYQPDSNFTEVEGFDHYSLPFPCNCLNGGTCLKSNSSFMCTCLPGYKGDNCQSYYRDCSEVRAAGISMDGVYAIDPDGRGKFPVLCEMTTDGSGWTVLFKRFDFTVNFNRNWEAYKSGFGNISHGEFWLGNENIHRLTSSRAVSLRFDLEDTSGLQKFAKYSTFQLSAESDFYRLKVAGYSGTAGDSLGYSAFYNSRSNNMSFSTPDKDNDLWGGGRCAKTDGWWYNYCAATQPTRSDKKILWMVNTNMKRVTMKLRPNDP